MSVHTYWKCPQHKDIVSWFPFKPKWLRDSKYSMQVCEGTMFMFEQMVIQSCVANLDSKLKIGIRKARGSKDCSWWVPYCMRLFNHELEPRISYQMPQHQVQFPTSTNSYHWCLKVQFSPVFWPPNEATGLKPILAWPWNLASNSWLWTSFV